MASKKSGGFSQILIQKIGPTADILADSFRSELALDLTSWASEGAMVACFFCHAFGELGMQISHGWIQTIEKIEHPLQIQVSF